MRVARSLRLPDLPRQHTGRRLARPRSGWRRCVRSRQSMPRSRLPKRCAVLHCAGALVRPPGFRTAAVGKRLAFTFAVTFAALLRPDGRLVGIAVVSGRRRRAACPRARSFAAWCRSPASVVPCDGGLRIGLVCLLLALAPFAAWTWRNWRVFHVFNRSPPATPPIPANQPTPAGRLDENLVP